jgi:hypothetical protein
VLRFAPRPAANSLASAVRIADLSIALRWRVGLALACRFESLCLSRNFDSRRFPNERVISFARKWSSFVCTVRIPRHSAVDEHFLHRFDLGGDTWLIFAG